MHGGFGTSLQGEVSKGVWHRKVMLEQNHPPWCSSSGQQTMTMNLAFVSFCSSYYYCSAIIVYVIATTYIVWQSLSRSIHLVGSFARMSTWHHFFTWRVWPMALLPLFLITSLTLRKLLILTDADSLFHWAPMDVSDFFYFILEVRCSTGIFVLFLASPHPFAAGQ